MSRTYTHTHILGPGTILRGGCLWTGPASAPEDSREYFTQIEIINRVDVHNPDIDVWHAVGSFHDGTRAVVTVEIGRKTGEYSIYCTPWHWEGPIG